MGRANPENLARKRQLVSDSRTKNAIGLTFLTWIVTQRSTAKTGTNVRWECVCSSCKAIKDFQGTLIFQKRIGPCKCQKLKSSHKSRSLSDSARIAKNLRKRVYNAFKRSSARKYGKTRDLIGCSGKELVEYISSKFLPGMTLENYGEWHIDHIKPVASFDLRDQDQCRQCFGFRNLQPLWRHDNLSKGAMFEGIWYSTKTRNISVNGSP